MIFVDPVRVWLIAMLLSKSRSGIRIHDLLTPRNILIEPISPKCTNLKNGPIWRQTSELPNKTSQKINSLEKKSYIRTKQASCAFQIWQSYNVYAYFAAAAFLAIWCAFRLCFLANFIFLKNLGSIPLTFILCLVEGFLVGLRWCFLVWLWLVWFFDFAII